MSADNSHGRRRGSQSGEKSTNFIDGFVINHLLQHSERKNLVEFETKDGRYLLRFTDVEEVSNCYWEYKLKQGKELKRDPQKKRDNFLNSMAQFQQKGKLKKVGSGNELEKEFVTYQIYDDVLWRSLTQNPRSSHVIEENLGADNVGASLPTSGLETSDTMDYQRDNNEERTGSWSSIYTNASGEDTHLGMALSDDPLYQVILSPNLPADETRREILPSEISSDAQDFSQSDDLRDDKAHCDIGANVSKTSSDTGLDATQSDEQLCNQGECSFKTTATSNDWLVRPSDHSTSEASGLQNIPAGSGPKATKNEIWFDFVCAYLPKDVQGRKLVKLVRKEARCFVLFSDIGKLSLFYRDFKRQNGGQDLKGDADSRKKILKNLLAPSTEEKLVKISAFGEDIELKKEFIKYEILDKDLRGALSSKYAVRKKRDMKCEDGDTSSDTGLGVSEDPSFKDLGLSFSNKMALHDKYLHENEAVNQNNQMDPLQVEITPKASSVEVEWSFNINANQDLPEAFYFIRFGEYGTCLAWGDGQKCLQGKDNIPKPTRTETHEVQVTVIDESWREIGHCLFTYIGTNSNANKQKVPSEDQSSSDRLGTLSRPQQATKKSSNGPMGNVVPSKRSRPSDMSLLMYLCDKMARRGDEDFFRALVKLGILADVLANCSNYSKSCAVTAQEHGHSKLAELIVMSRNPSCDNLMEKLTLEKLVDAVRVERSLVNSIYSSDDVSDSSLNGYDGDSEDDKLSSNGDSDDDDSCYCIIPQERETDYEKVELDSLELAESYEILEVESKRVPSLINVPMVRAQFESSAVETLNINATRRPIMASVNYLSDEEYRLLVMGMSCGGYVSPLKDLTSIVAKLAVARCLRLFNLWENPPLAMCEADPFVKCGAAPHARNVRLDNMDVQAVRTAVVETTSFPTSVDHSTNLKIGHDCDLPGTGTSKPADIQTRYNTGDDLSSNAGSDDDESCSRTIAQDLNEEKGSANCGITEQGEQVQESLRREYDAKAKEKDGAKTFHSTRCGKLNFNKIIGESKWDDIDKQAAKKGIVETTNVPTSAEHSTKSKMCVSDLPSTRTPKLSDIQTLHKKTDLPQLMTPSTKNPDNHSIFIENETISSIVYLFVYSTLDPRCCIWYKSKSIPPNTSYYYSSTSSFKYELRIQTGSARRKIILPVSLWAQNKRLLITESEDVIQNDLSECSLEFPICVRKTNMDNISRTIEVIDLYAILDLDIKEVLNNKRGAIIKQISKAYRKHVLANKLAKLIASMMGIFHHDRNADTGVCQEINLAHSILADRNKRARYHDVIDFAGGWLSKSRWKMHFSTMRKNVKKFCKRFTTGDSLIDGFTSEVPATSIGSIVKVALKSNAACACSLVLSNVDSVAVEWKGMSLKMGADLNEEKESANDDIIKQRKEGEEAKAKDKDVTKRVPSEKNVPMICAQVESSGVKTSRSITVMTGLCNIDKQALKTAVVETGTPKSADTQTLHKTDDALSSNVSSDDDESRSHAIAKAIIRVLRESMIDREELNRAIAEIAREKEERKHQFEILRFFSKKEGERIRQLQLDKYTIATFGNVNKNVLGRFKCRGGRWKIILMSSKSGCGKSVVDLTRKIKMTTSNSSLSDLNFEDPSIMKKTLAVIKNILVFIDELHMQEKRHGFHNLTNPLTMCMENRFHELAVIGGLDERTVNEKCDMVEIITRIPPINVLGTSTLVPFSEKQQFAESSTRGQTARHAVEFGNAISDVELKKPLAKNVSSSLADVYSTLEAKTLSNETGPGDEVQSTCAKDVTWIALDFARTGDEVFATKVEIVSKAISENDSENTERTDITATASIKNERDEQI